MLSLFYVLGTILLICKISSGQRVSSHDNPTLRRRILDFSNGFTTSTLGEVKLVEENQASCDLSLKTHSDNVLNDMFDAKIFATKILSNELNVTLFWEMLRRKEIQLRESGCPNGAEELSIGVSLRKFKKIPVSVYFNIDLPDMSTIPVYYGFFDQSCRVQIRHSSNKLILKHTTLLEPPNVGGETHLAESTTMVMDFGASGIVLDVHGSALVNIDGKLSCTNPRDIEPRSIPLRDNVAVDEIRKLLASDEIGVQQNRARSFMVMGFHPRDYSQ